MPTSAHCTEATVDPLLAAMVEGKRRVREREVINRLFDALSDNDKDRIASFFSDETVFQPLQRDRVTGRAAIWSTLQAVDGPVERRLLRVTSAADGSVRADVAERRLHAGSWQEFRLTSTFAVRGCKILHWSESVAR